MVFRSLSVSLVSGAALLVATPEPQPFRRPLVFEPNRGQAPAAVKWIGRGSGYQVLIGQESLTILVREGVPQALRATQANERRAPRLGAMSEAIGSAPERSRDREGAVLFKGVPQAPRATQDDENQFGVSFVRQVGRRQPAGRSPIGLRRLTTAEQLGKLPHKLLDRMLFKGAGSDIAPRPARYSVLHIKLTGSNPWRYITGLEPTGGVSNYYCGAAAGETSYESIPNFARVRIAGVYDGIDLVLYGNDGDLEYDLVVAPGSDLSQIRLAFDGIEQMRVNDSGDLVFTTPAGSELTQLRPRIYQRTKNGRVEIPGRYKLQASNQAAFAISKYDRSQPLVIDPTVSFTRFLMGELADVATAIAADNSGNSYITGYTNSSHFPLQNPLFPKFVDCDSGWSGFCSSPDAFITKLSPAGEILFSTYFGAGTGYAIAVDSTGLYVTGLSDTPDEIKGQGKGDVFISKLSVDGGKVIYNRMVGGSDNDAGLGIAVDPQQNVWVTGVTSSKNFPGQTNPPNLDEVILIKVDAAGTVIFARAFGGNDYDEGTAISVDRNGNPWITGRTCSPDFFATFDFSSGGCTTFVAALFGAGRPRDPGFGTIRFITRFGGSYDGDGGTGIVVDTGGNAFITGRTMAPDFLTTRDAFQKSPASDQSQAFVVELDPQGIISHSTLLGGDQATTGTSIALYEGTLFTPAALFVAGRTASTNFPGAPPLTPNPTAGFVSKFSTDLSELAFTTLLGAEVNGIAAARDPFQPGLAIYTAGSRLTGSNTDAFVVKLLDGRPKTF